MLRFRLVALALLVCAGSLAWGIAITHRTYDFDEVQRAHSVWMTSQGLRPYADFLECHPPYFALLAPLARSPEDPGALLLKLRWIAAIGNLLFLAGLATVATTTGGSDRVPAILGTALVAFHPDVITFLAEFRIDGWGYALALWSIVWFLRSRGRWRHIGLGFGTGIATLLFCPKLALLPPMIVIFDQVQARASFKRALSAIVTYAAGLCAAGAVFWVWLLANGIGVAWVLAYLVRYHALSNFHSAFGYGMLREIAVRPTLGVPILFAIVTWLIQSLRAPSRPNAYLAALVVWLAAQAALVSYPWKQYYAPWCLFASAFFPFLYDAAKPLFRQAANTVVFGLSALSILASVVAGYGWMSSRDAENLGRLLRILNAVTNPEDRVVATPPFHPIFRKDTFYVWFNTLDPSGYETEQIMDAIPLVRGLATEQMYRQELESNPPAFVVLSPETYPRRQETLLTAFLREREYVGSTVGNVAVAVRPDHLEQFLRNRAMR